MALDQDVETRTSRGRFIRQFAKAFALGVGLSAVPATKAFATAQGSQTCCYDPFRCPSANYCSTGYGWYCTGMCPSCCACFSQHSGCITKYGGCIC
jgi:hypothetical protein